MARGRVRTLISAVLLALVQVFVVTASPLPNGADHPAGASGAQGDPLEQAASLRAEIIRLYQQKRYAEAIPVAERALRIYEKALGADHPEVALSLNIVASLYQDLGALALAEPLFVRALTIRERALGADHVDVATSLNNLALLYRAQGAYARAAPLLDRALRIYEKTLGRDHVHVATCLNNLALVYRAQGAYARAEPLFVRSLGILEKALGADDVHVARSLNNLAVLYRAQRAYARAEPLYLRSLKIYEMSLGSDHPEVATSLNNLAALYQLTGAHDRAEPLYERALRIYEKTYGAAHPEVATSLTNLASLYQDRGAYAQAEPLYARSLAIREEALGPDHPYLASGLQNSAVCSWAAGNLRKAASLQSRAGDVREREFLVNLASGSERAKLLYISQTAFEQDIAVSLHVRGAPVDPNAMRVALEAVVRRKGRALDVMSDAVGSLRRRASPDDQRLLDELAETRARLTTLTLQGPEKRAVARHRADLEALDTRVDALEAQISARSAEFRAAVAPVTLDAVRARIPAGASLVELASYRAYDPSPRTFGAARYAVYVAGRSGEIAWADLGEATAVDAAVERLRAVLRDPRSDLERDVKPAARALDELVFRPVRKLAGASRRLLIAPDGALNLVPFDALVDEAGRFAVESYEISYLSSGRDLLRLAVRGESREPARVFANPDFGPKPGAKSEQRLLVLDASAPDAPAASVLARAFFPPLAGTAAEAEALRTVIPDVQVVTGAAVTKAALERLDSPRILHVATHGFFLAARPAPPPDARLLLLTDSEEIGAPADPSAGLENPLLRSGLALAGANLHRGGEGILTAYEASGLDLWGTKLVALSACDTGVGEVRSGDGVYGLRRALVLAGSETQAMSLWPVSDEGTRELMVAFYRALVSGEGRSAAMRGVRLAMLADPKRRHPFYWASFIVSGAWDPIAR